MSKNIIFIAGLVVVAVATGLILKNIGSTKNAGPSEIVIKKETETDKPGDSLSDEEIANVDTPDEFLPTIETGSGTAATPAPLADTSSPVKSDATLPKTHSIEIKNFSYSPATVTIKRGDKITWTNRDEMKHTATGSGFDTGLLAKDESKTITFSTPGEFSYTCTPHPNMKGKVIVQ